MLTFDLSDKVSCSDRSNRLSDDDFRSMNVLPTLHPKVENTSRHLLKGIAVSPMHLAPMINRAQIAGEVRAMAR